MECPGDGYCNGYGTCLTMYRAALEHGLDHPAGYSPGGDGIGFYYTGWEAYSLSTCICDWGPYTHFKPLYLILFRNRTMGR